MSGIELLERIIKHIWNRVACGIKLQNPYSGAFPIQDTYQIPLGKFLLFSDIIKYSCYALNILIKSPLIHLPSHERNPEEKAL